MDIIGILVLVISFFFLLVVGVPVAYSIGVAGILTMLVNIDSLPALTTYAMRMASGLDSFALLAIPFFILAGNIMNSGGIALRLIDFAKVLVGRLPGGLAVVNVVANMLFGAISGSAAAAASAIGSIMTPEMKKAGPVKDRPVERGAPDSAYLAEVTRAAKDSGFREAPPTRAPSMSGWAMSSSTFSGFTEPPYWMRTLAAASAPKTSEITLRIKEWAS